jgi:hypothetical protein
MEFSFVAVPVKAHEFLLFDLEVLEQIPRHPGVFAYDRIALPERFDGPQGDIAQVSDGCGNYREHW